MMVEARRIAALATRDLRQRILRPDQRAGDLARPGDDDPLTAHFGAHDDHGRLVAIATVMPERERDPEGPGDWRVRGVATEPDARGHGYGRAVIEACIAHARANGGQVAWLNGRVSSGAFYERLGFAAVGEPFDTPPTGLHRRFRRELV